MKTIARMITLAGLMAGAAAFAQTQTRTSTVYRCGPDGRELRDSPCPSNPRAAGTPVEVDHPSASDTKAARERAIADARRAQEMQQQRQRDEAQAQRDARQASGINGLAVPAAARPASAPRQPAAPKPPKAPKLAKPAKPVTSVNDAAPRAASAPR